MHEIGLIQSAIGAALKSAAQHGARRIERITMRVGAESGIDPAVIDMVFPISTRGTIAEGAQLEIELVPARCRCPRCGTEFVPADELRACPCCGELRASPVAGYEFSLLAVEI
jgi:hydrogenase nickel incorporation protein HypA/HybF